MCESAGQRGAGQRHHHQIADREVRCAADDLASPVFADVDIAGADRLLELGELLDLGDASHRQRTVDRAERDDLFDLVADAHQRLLEIVRVSRPSRERRR